MEITTVQCGTEIVITAKTAAAAAAHVSSSGFPSLHNTFLLFHFMGNFSIPGVFASNRLAYYY